MPRSLDHPWFKQERILADLRGHIVAGDWSPGSRLPTREELQERFGVSSVTIQRTLDRLVADGFVEARGRHGTFVVGDPPHACRHALVVPELPEAGGWVRFWTALLNEARPAAARRGCSMAVFTGVDGHADSEDQQRLVADIQARRIAGLILPGGIPANLESTPVATSGLPLVVITHRVVPVGAHGISLDQDSLIEAALDHFASRGRRRLAVLGVPGQRHLYARLAEAARQRGLAIPPWWFQGCDPARLPSEGARNLAHLMLRGPAGERPDALLIWDDNLVEHATAGLVDAGIRVPRDLEVIAHCNIPWPTPSLMPVHRLGFDAREVLDIAMALIERLRAGERAPRETAIVARFAEPPTPP